MDATQSRLGSLVETFLNIGSGFVLSVIVWQILAYYLGIPMPLDTNLFITSVFTVVSITRSYLWRRFFANGLHRTVMRWFR
ncbi:MAG: DUF7220 family protein [Planctomycetota bacterium]|jgi:hypothetical protein